MSQSDPGVNRDVVVMGASAGGVDALVTVLRALPGPLPASIAIVQHRPATASNVLLDILRRETRMPVEWAEQGGRHDPGRVYLAPPDVHLTFADGHFSLTASARENHARPSINRLFRSAAAHYGGRTIGVLMTGLLDDGVAGLAAISRVGGETIVQDPATAMAPDLPRNAIAAVPTSRIVPLERIAGALVEATRTAAPETSVPDGLRRESVADTRPSRPDELDQFAQRTGMTCDECGGPLWHVADGGPPRFRCYLGHAMSANDRLAKYDDEVEVALWTAVRSLNERAATLESLAVDARSRQDSPAASEFDQRAREAFQQSRLAYEFMTNMTMRR